MSDQQTEKFESWGLLELMGRTRIAGRMSEQKIGGAEMLRVDIPAVDGQPAHTRFFGSSAIYGITPTSQEVAVALAARLRSRPIEAYELPQRQLPLERADDADNAPDDDEWAR